MNSVKLAVSGFAAGAAVMYLADPDRGKRRRALARDRSVRMLNSFSGMLDKAQRDASNRTKGLVHAIRGTFRTERADNQVLVQRVRSHLGRLVGHPHAIEVEAEDGKIVLRGPVLRNEVAHLLRCARAIPGVTDLEDKLDVQESAEHFSSLQGGTRREGRSEFMQQNWTPVLRITAGALGGALILYGLREDGPPGWACALAGTALLGRAISNRELRDLVGAGGAAPAVEFDKTFQIRASPVEVFRFWADYQKLPSFMTHLREVCDLGQGRSHWVAEGPAGISVSWDAEVTQAIPNKLLAWRSIPGSTIETEGVVRFDESPNGSTRVGIRMLYKPPVGVLGHYVASLFGADPKAEIDEDMVRLKSLLERGKTRAHGITVSRESLVQGELPEST
jgi:uncharacterized membrane protein